jgi:hypothetical protein
MPGTMQKLAHKIRHHISQNFNKQVRKDGNRGIVTEGQSDLL